MPAHNESFPWMSYCGSYRFFEDRLQSHNKVSNVEETNTGLYEITLTDGRTLITFICECYSFGVAEYYESVGNLGSLNVVIINSMWCGYTMEAKVFCRGQNIGLFDITGFMAALNKNNYWEYLTESEKKHLEKNNQL